MAEIIFTEDYEVKDEKKTVHKKGKKMQCSEATAQHFLRKSVAITVEDYKQQEENEKKAKAAEKLVVNEEASETELEKPLPSSKQRQAPLIDKPEKK